MKTFSARFWNRIILVPTLVAAMAAAASAHTISWYAANTVEAAGDNTGNGTFASYVPQSPTPLPHTFEHDGSYGMNYRNLGTILYEAFSFVVHPVDTWIITWTPDPNNANDTPGIAYPQGVPCMMQAREQYNLITTMQGTSATTGIVTSNFQDTHDALTNGLCQINGSAPLFNSNDVSTWVNGQVMTLGTPTTPWVLQANGTYQAQVVQTDVMNLYQVIQVASPTPSSKTCGTTGSFKVQICIYQVGDVIIPTFS